jgi:hypothetical protein
MTNKTQNPAAPEITVADDSIDITVTITIPKFFTVSKRNGAAVSARLAKLPLEQVRELFLYGLGQKVRDASSAFPDPDDSNTAMQKCLDALYANQWAMRATASGDPLDPYRIAIIREALAKPHNKDSLALYTAIPSDQQKDRRAFLLALAARNSVPVDAEATRRLAEAREAEAATNSLDF